MRETLVKVLIPTSREILHEADVTRTEFWHPARTDISVQ